MWLDNWELQHFWLFLWKDLAQKNIFKRIWTSLNLDIPKWLHLLFVFIFVKPLLCYEHLHCMDDKIYVQSELFFWLHKMMPLHVLSYLYTV